MKIVWTDCAREKLTDFAELVFREAGPQSALKWMMALKERVQMLETHPRLGREVPEVGRANIRELRHRDHRVIYKVDDEEETCTILSLRHARQKTTRENFDA